MKDRHLSREQLIAFRDGALHEPRALEHLATCSHCQRAFDDSRWMLALSRLRGQAGEEAHPDRDLLVAYLTHALDSRAAARVSRHLRSCDRCVARYRRFREAEASVRYSSPSPKLLRATQRRFSARPQVLELGKLVLRRLGEALLPVFQPAEIENALSARPSLHRWVPSEDAPPCRPASAKTRDRPRRDEIARLLEEAGEPLAEEPADECFGDTYEAHLTTPREPAGMRDLMQDLSAAGDPREAWIDRGPWRLVVTAVPEQHGATLVVAAHDRETAKPIRGMILTLETESGARLDAATEEGGSARFPLPPGRSTLLIRERESARLIIDLPE